MAEPSLQLGNGNWAGKSGNLLAYHKANNNFYADELTFARASTGTIVNADGLIEQVPYNLASYSEQFDNAYWAKSGASVTSGFTSPIGDLSAFKLTESSASGVHLLANTAVSTNGLVSGSIYAKYLSRYLRLTIHDTTNANEWYSVIYDLENGTIYDSLAKTVTVFDSEIEQMTDGYYRCVINADLGASSSTILYTQTSNGAAISSADDRGRCQYQGDGTSGIYIYGAQLNSGSTAKTYYPTTTRLNVPRVDYLNNSNGSLLLESQRTNLITQSSNLSLLSKVSVGTASAPVTTANYATSPDGTMNATRVVFDLNGGSGRSILRQAIPLGSDYYFSIYVKSTDGTDQKVMWHDGGEQITTTVTNEWQRITYDARSGVTYAGIALNANSGVDTSDILVWGFQVEIGSYPTSYIPTSGTTVTRNLDTFYSDTNAIGQTEGTFYLETVPLNSLTSYTERVVQFESSGSDFMTIQRSANSTITFYGTDGVNSWSIVQIGLFVGGETIKIAGAYKDNDIALYVNGVQIGTNTSASAPQTQKLRFANNASGSLGYIGSHQEFQLYKTRLTNAELATLTTI